ncbi:MAG: flagellar hook-basal body complex protein, partial [Candidatus Krumholzibacteriota bacterium]|nr:flagellar hook-basal body complex protein [Candidatus Krumholzibacteriota bacterium]
MLRSLFAGVTGLANHQLKLDVIGNNIANINTLGFKSSRVTFREMLTQTIRGASRPSVDGNGGTNPQQIGLGSSVGSIDTDFSQGNMQITGIMTDLAIEGEGFFILSDGFTQYYTRDGAFSLDGIGRMINPGNGYKLQGILADEYGVISQGQGIEDIVIPSSLVVPARATTEIELSGNLNVDSDARGTLTISDSLMAAATGSNLLTLLNDGSGDALGLMVGDRVSIQASIAGTDIDTDYTITTTSTLQELADAVRTALQGV